MKVNKLQSYAPEYPAKKGFINAARIGAVAAAALLVTGTAAGCTVSANGYLVDPPAVTEDAPQVDGLIMADPTEEIHPVGIVDADPTEVPCTHEPGKDQETADPTEDIDDVELMGDVVADPGTIGD